MMESKENIKFSIVVPLFNAEKYLDACIQSVLEQTYHNFELILIDDGSHDDSKRICDFYNKKDDRVKVIHQENAGQTAARKKGLSKCSGDYILFLDSDDWFENTTLEKCSDILNKEPIDMLLFGFKEFQNSQYKNIFMKYEQGYYTKKDKEERLYPTLLMDKYGEFFPRALWGKVFKRESILKCINSVPELIRNGEDMCCIIHVLLHINSIYIIDEPLYCYRNDNMKSVSKSSDDLALKRCKVMAEYVYGLIENDPFLLEQYWRLIVQQIYSACLRTYESIGMNEDFKKQFSELMENSLCKDAIKNARFSIKSMKMVIKHCILKYRLFWMMKLLRKMS